MMKRPMKKSTLLMFCALLALAGQAAGQKQPPGGSPIKRTIWVAPDGFIPPLSTGRNAARAGLGP